MTSTTRERVVLAIEDGVTARPVNGKHLVLVHDPEWANQGWLYAALPDRCQPYGPRLRYNVHDGGVTIGRAPGAFSAYWRFEPSPLPPGTKEVSDLDALIRLAVDELVPIPFDEDSAR